MNQSPANGATNQPLTVQLRASVFSDPDGQDFHGASQWLVGEIDKLRSKVTEAEGRVEAFRAKANLLVGTNNTTLSNQQLGDLNTQLTTARAQKAEAETRANSIRELLRKGEAIEASDVLNSERPAEGKEQEG